MIICVNQVLPENRMELKQFIEDPGAVFLLCALTEAQIESDKQQTQCNFILFFSSLTCASSMLWSAPLT